MKRKIQAIYWALAILLALAVVVPGLTTIHAQQSNRVGLVVRFGDGSLITRCVEFAESEISGYDLLTRSGLSIVAAFDSGQGAAICAIEGTGCPVESCLTCATPNYWSYWHLSDGAWVYSQVGAGGYTVHDGDVDGWSWGAGGPPPVVPFDQICAPPPTDTPMPTDTSLPPTDTPPPPTDTPAPPTSASLPPTPTAWFRLDDNPIAAGACTNVRWDTSNAQAIYLDGESVSATGSLRVCPTAPQEYTLRLASAAGDQIYTLVLGVTGTAPTGTLTPHPTIVPSTSPSSTAQPTVVASRSDAVLPQSVTALTPSLSPTAQLVAIVLPSPTPAREAELSLVASPTPFTQPTHTPSMSAISQPAAGEQEPASNGKDSASAMIPIGYIVFSLSVGGLLGWLVFGIRRRK